MKIWIVKQTDRSGTYYRAFSQPGPAEDLRRKIAADDWEAQELEDDRPEDAEECADAFWEKMHDWGERSFEVIESRLD